MISLDLAGLSILNLPAFIADLDRLAKSLIRFVQEDIRVRNVVKSLIQRGSDVPSSVSLRTRQAKVREWMKIAPLVRLYSGEDICTTFGKYEIVIERSGDFHEIMIDNKYFISLGRSARSKKEVRALYKATIDLISEPAILAFEGRKARGCITINLKKLLKTRKAHK